MKLLVTGGCGFIGSALVRFLVNHTDYSVLNVDKLTYAGNLESLTEVAGSSRYQHVKADIADRDAMQELIAGFKPDGIIHLAAESHVDRSIDSPGEFIQTNVFGTYVLLDVARHYWSQLSVERQERFRFQHVSTDEVYGDLGDTGALFTESTKYDPSSPYSASKAASDHFVRAWGRTYGLPVLITNCSNNYGPYHFPEKLIPHVILNAISGRPLPVYGDGCQIRDWLYVDDHVEALHLVFQKGEVGETYNIGGNAEMKNIEVVTKICDLLEELAPDCKPGGSRFFSDLITFVQDRPGHDVRYAIDASKIERELGWKPKETFETGLRRTVTWYLENEKWWQRVLSGDYRLSRIGICRGID